MALENSVCFVDLVAQLLKWMPSLLPLQLLARLLMVAADEVAVAVE